MSLCARTRVQAMIQSYSNKTALEATRTTLPPRRLLTQSSKQQDNRQQRKQKINTQKHDSPETQLLKTGRRIDPPVIWKEFPLILACHIIFVIAFFPYFCCHSLFLFFAYFTFFRSYFPHFFLCFFIYLCFN